MGCLFLILANLAMIRKLSCMIITTYMTYMIPVWGYLAPMHTKMLKNVLDRGFKLST